MTSVPGARARFAPEDAHVTADLDAGRRVLTLESRALRALARTLDADFSRLVTALSQVRGRVIVTGMGKSGHIGCKIAATLASTGTPASFVHPAEASHGDLGMITDQDAVLALSNSGETKELEDVVCYARRFAIPLAAITGRRDSALAEAADIVLILPDQPEACAIGLAPTTSTTMTLALGDALAVALLERKGFTASDFQRFHPGGKLGRRLLRMRDLMHGLAELPLAGLKTPMRQALLIMAAKRFGCVGVQDDAGQLAGIVTDGDLRRHMAPDLLERTLSEIMTATPVATTAEALAVDVIASMNSAKIGVIFVVDAAGHPIGIAHLHDFLRAGLV